ncbi:MAG: SpoIIE family protein phosphatase [Bacteriovoracaceae bacterium]|nr:SpoIIE family protein phosphatase [Bacteriovoracaceae bacterium]
MTLEQDTPATNEDQIQAELQTRKIYFSTRSKLLSVFILLLTAALAANMYISRDMFVKDKSAYIFENSINKVETLGEGFRFIVQNSINLSAPMGALALAPETQEPESTTGAQKNDFDIFHLNDNLLLYSIHTKDQNKPLKILLNDRLIDEYGKKYSFSHDEIKSRTLAFLQTQESSGEVVSVQGLWDTLGAPLMLLQIRDEKNSMTYSSIIGMENLTRLFLKEKRFENYMVGTDRKIHIGKDAGKTMKSSFLKQIMKSKTDKGTLKISESSGEEFLVAYSKMNTFSVIIISKISVTKAFKAMNTMIYRWIYFGTFILAVATILIILMSLSITGPIRSLLAGTHEISKRNFNHRIQVKTHDELGVLADSFNYMSDQIAIYINEMVHKARMENELQTAQTVQQTLFPAKSKKFPELEISGYYEPVSECNGDWWYYFKKKNKYYFIISDATGHGVPAALMTSAARSSVSVLQIMPELSLPQMAKIINKAICQISKGKLFMTFFLASYDPKDHTMEYVNASHNSPMLFNLSEGIDASKAVFLDQGSDPRMGEDKKREFKSYKQKITSDHILFFYTDGLAEIENENKTQLGERRIIKFLKKAHDEGADIHGLTSSLIKSAKEYLGDKTAEDDVTYFFVQFN